MTNHHKE